MDLKGISAIVTGGASGLGGATTTALAWAGAHVIAFDLNEELGAAISTETGAEFVRGDVTNDADVQAAIEAAGLSGRPLRALVNCAGTGWGQRLVGRDGTYESAHDSAAFERVTRVNLFGTFNVTRLVATAIGREVAGPEGRGAVVHTASVAGYEGQVGQVSYAASKAGIIGMTLPMARDLAPLGIRVNTIAPGLFDTPLLGQASDQEKAQLAASVVHPRRLGEPREFATMALEALRNDYLNGETIRLDAALRMPPR